MTRGKAHLGICVFPSAIPVIVLDELGWRVREFAKQVHEALPR
jgi:hypothetical protein